MELRHLRYFVAVAEELNFRRAAETLHVAQGSVSEQVHKLEEELGVRLLNRSNRCVSLTDAGAALLTEARRVLQQAEVARLAARSGRDRATSQFQIGYMPACLPGAVPRTLQRLASATPRLENRLEPGSAPELIDAVRTERLDAAIVAAPAAATGLRLTPIGEQYAVAAWPSDHRHARRAELRLDQVAPERLLVLPREANRPFHDAVVASCRAAGLAPSYVEMHDAHIERLLLAVAAGAGMAVLPECIAERYSAPGVSFVPLRGEHLMFEAAVVTRRETEHLPTVAFLRAIIQSPRSRPMAASDPAVRSARPAA